MPMVTVSENLDNVKTGFDPLPVGEYLVKCEMPEEVKSKKGSRMLNCKGTVLEPIIATNEAGEEVTTEGRVMFWNLMLEGDGLGITKGFLEAAGITWEGNTFNTDLIAGVMVRVKNTHRLYDGRIRDNVAGFNPQ